MKNSINFILLLLILLNHPLIASAQETQQTQEQNPVAEAFFAASTIAFLGDSITYRGTFITDLESTMVANGKTCLLYTSPSPRDATLSRMPSSA